MIDDQKASAYAQAVERSRAVFAQSDYPLIKDALLFYAHNANITDSESFAISNLIHRLGRVDK